MRRGIPVKVITTFSSYSLDRAAEVYEKSKLPYAVHAAVPAAGIMKKLYQNAPDSQGELGRYKGRKYVKHDDYYDEHCFGNNHSREETFIINF